MIAFGFGWVGDRNTYSEKISEYAEARFKREDIDVVTSEFSLFSLFLLPCASFPFLR